MEYVQALDVSLKCVGSIDDARGQNCWNHCRGPLGILIKSKKLIEAHVH